MPAPAPVLTSSAHLALRHVDRQYPDRVVLRDVSLVVAPGARVALVGENGAGKTTLLRVAAGVDDADSGSVLRPERTRLVHQVLPFDDAATVDDVLDDAVASARDVERELTAAADALAATTATSTTATTSVTPAAQRAAAHRYDVALAEATAAGVWSLDAEVERVVAGLGLAGVPRDRPVGALSGGQRTRLALASALVARPTALLLDEPTNHLDAAGADFLAAELRSWSGPVLFASHDRRFIEDVATRVADLDPGRADAPLTSRSTTSAGAYSDHLRAKADARRRWEEQHATEQEQLEVLRHEVAVGARDVMHTTEPKSEVRGAKKFSADRAATTIARRVRSARTRLEELERTQVAAPPPLLRFAGFAPRRTSPPTDLPPDAPDVLVQLDDVEVAGRLARTSLTVRPGEHLLLDGPNGSGKSTLIAVLVGALDPDRGVRSSAAGAGVGVGLLAQDVTWPDPAATPQQVYLRAVGEHAPSLVSTGLVSAADVDRPIGALSVGQQRRLALAVLTAVPPDLLVLDEPTNHLSLGLAEELEAALVEFSGAVVLASHDRWLRERWTGARLDLSAPAPSAPAPSAPGQTG